MANTTPYLREQLLNHVLRGVPYSPSRQVFLGLFVASNRAEIGFSEIELPDYKRQSVTFSAPSNGSVDNLAGVSFGPALTDWGKVVALGVFDTIKGGNALLISPLQKELTVEDGATFVLEAGKVTISLS